MLKHFKTIDGNFATDLFKISKSTYGTVLGFLLCITFFTNIGIATINDKFQRPRLCLIGLLCISAAFFQLFYIQTYIQLWFGMFWINLLMFLMFNTSIPPLLDKITLDILRRKSDEAMGYYGRQRMWGTIGYLIANLIIEWSITDPNAPVHKEASGKSKKEYNFNGLRIYQLVTTIIATTLSFFLIRGSSRQSESGERHDILDSFKKLLSNMNYLFFICIILLNGITRAAMTMYLTIYLTDIVQISGYDTSAMNKYLAFFVNLFNNNPLATTSFFGAILEVPILWNSARIIRKLGLYWPLLLAQGCQLMRFALYLFMNHETYHAFILVCSFELLKGCNFGLTHISAVQMARDLCPEHLKTTSQMIYSGTFTGLASVFAGVIFGSIFSKESMQGKEATIQEKVGTFSTFYTFNVIFNLASILLFVYKYGFIDRKLKIGEQVRETGEETPKNDNNNDNSTNCSRESLVNIQEQDKNNNLHHDNVSRRRKIGTADGNDDENDDV